MRHAISCAAGALVLSNCYFFEAKLDDCLGSDASERGGCPNAGGDGDGEMGGKSPAAGGRSDASGGRLGGGGTQTGGAVHSGGMTASGGRHGSGGRDQAGGAPIQPADGGAGGENGSGGQGGDVSTGGGEGTGGDGTGGGMSNSELVSLMSLNEVRRTTYGFIEIYNSTEEIVQFDGLLVGFLRAEGPEYQDQCELEDLILVEPGDFALVLGESADCPLGSPCVTCEIDIQAEDLISILEVQEGNLVPLLSLKYPAAGPNYPEGWQTWAAFPDGSSNYMRSDLSTPGTFNE